MSMLDNDQYVNLDNDKPILSKIEDCCETAKTGELKSSDCCFNNWKGKHRDVTADYKKVCAEALLAKKNWIL